MTFTAAAALVLCSMVSPTEPVALPQFVPIPGVMEFSGRLTVLPRAGSEAAFDAAWKEAIIEVVEATRERIVRVPENSSEAELAAQMIESGRVEYAEPDWRCFPVSTTPLDPQFASQWHHINIQSAAAWDLWRGGSTVTLGFVDTGVDLNHSELAALRVPGFNSATDTEEALGGDVSGLSGHGTAVAGTACAIGTNNQGVCGVHWATPFMMVRASEAPDGGAFLSDLTQGARWCADHGARAVSVSYSGVSNSTVQTTGAYIKTVNGLLTWAAGNNGALLNPFDHLDVIIVGATNSGDGRAGFSNYGLCIDVVAPGEGIYTTFQGGGTGPTSGTSFSAPMTNGIVGLIWSVNPALTPAEVQTILFDSCDDLGAAGDDETFGRGRINAFRAVQAALATSSTPLAPMAGDDTVNNIFRNEPGTVFVLANDRDPRGTALTISAPAMSAQGGSVVILPESGLIPSRVLYTPPTDFGGEDSFTYTLTNAAGLTDSATVTVIVLDPSTFRAPETPVATAAGLDVAYFAGAFDVLPDFSLLTPYATDVAAAIDFPSTGGVFATSGRADDVAARFTGYLIAPTPDRYILSIESDDGSKVYVGSSLLIGNDGLHGMQDKSETIDLQAGTHAITVDFFERGGGAGLIFRWSNSEIARQVVPAANLVRDRCPADTDFDSDVDSDDVSIFFAAWESGEGDFDGDDDSDSDDIILFFARWDSGC